MAGRQSLRRALWFAGVSIAFLILIPPLVKLNYWEAEIAAALSQGFGRRVHIGAAHLQFLEGPSLEIQNVLVEEDPRFGIEPFARIPSLRAVVPLRSLWQRRLQFSSLTLTNPSINIVRSAEGDWNLETLAATQGDRNPPRSLVSPTANDSGSSPRIQVDSGRINFKFRNQKAAFMLDEFDLDLAPPAAPGSFWHAHFDGIPTRTDSPLRPVSVLRGEAEFGNRRTGITEEIGTSVRLDLWADNALLDDWLRIFAMHEHGIHGLLNLHLHLEGTTSLLRVSGTADLSDLHRWDLLPPGKATTLQGQITGLLDLKEDTIQLTSLSLPLSRGAIVVQGTISRLLAQPQSDLHAELRGVPLADVAEIAQNFTERLNPGIRYDGILEGSVHVRTSPATFRGVLNVSDASLAQRDMLQQIHLSDFQVVLDGLRGRISSLQASTAESEALKASAQWDVGARTATIRLEGERVSVTSLAQWARALGVNLSQAAASDGYLAMAVEASLSAIQPPRLKGWARITDAVLQPAGLAVPIRVASASLLFRRDEVRGQSFQASVGGTELAGSFTARPALTRNGMTPLPQAWDIEFQAAAETLNVEDLSRLFSTSEASLFSFWKSSEEADALPQRLTARGDLQVDSLRYREWLMGNISAKVDFRDRVLEIRDFSGEFAGGEQTGKATVRFAADRPSFVAEARFGHVNLQDLLGPEARQNPIVSGRVSGEFRLASAGKTSKEILEQLGGSGVITGRDLVLHSPMLLGSGEENSRPATPLNSFVSAFQISKRDFLVTDLSFSVPANQSEEISKIEAARWIGTGSVDFDRHLDLWIRNTASDRYYHWTGLWREPRASEATAIPASALSTLLARK